MSLSLSLSLPPSHARTLSVSSSVGLGVGLQGLLWGLEGIVRKAGIEFFLAEHTNIL